MGASTVQERALGKNPQEAFHKIRKSHIEMFGDDYYGGSFSNARLATSRGFDLTHIKSFDKQETELKKLREQWWGSHGKNEVGFAVLKVLVGKKDDYEPEISKSQGKTENNTSIYEFEFFGLVPE